MNDFIINNLTNEYLIAWSGKKDGEISLINKGEIFL